MSFTDDMKEIFSSASKSRENKTAGIKPGTIVAILVAVVVLILIGSNVYFLKSNEQAVITFFGKHVRTEREPGMKFKVPLVEKKILVDTEGIRRMEFGYRTRSDGSYSEMMEEARMLTSDENLVIADWAVMYKVCLLYTSPSPRD